MCAFVVGEGWFQGGSVGGGECWVVLLGGGGCAWGFGSSLWGHWFIKLIVKVNRFKHHSFYGDICIIKCYELTIKWVLSEYGKCFVQKFLFCESLYNSFDCSIKNMAEQS